ncbi:MAG: DUF1772 domain-containing protein [Vicinamibacteria bacterium]
MPTPWGRIFLWLFVVDLGIAFGAGLYEHRIVLPQWVHDDPGGIIWFNAHAAREANTGLRFWVYVTTAPLTLLTLVNLVFAWRAPRVMRRFWLGAGVAALFDRVLTFSYFIPTMVALMNESLSEREAAERGMQWIQLNYVRHALVLAAWLLALKAFSMLGDTRAEGH